MYTFYKKYFLINLQDYPNIGLDFPITIFLACFFFALIVTTLIVNYRRHKMEELIKALTRHGATDETEAKTLGELKLDNKVFRHLLSREGQITKLVGRVGEVKPTYEEYIEKTKRKEYKDEKIDFSSARFFIRDEGRDRAKRIVEYGNISPLSTALFCLLLVAVFICLSLLMPGILSAINGFLGN